MVAWARRKTRVVIVGGVRTPFVKAGAAMRRVPTTELARVVLQEAIYRTGYPGDRLGEVVLGNVVMPAKAANPARVAAMQAGIPAHVPAVTVQRNCASGIEAIAQATTRIATEQSHSVLAAGAESMSTAPLIFPDVATGPMTALARARNWPRRLAAFSALRVKHFIPVASLEQGLTDPLCGMIMGRTAEVLAHEFGISRATQDEFALRSHRRAARATESGVFDEQIVPCYLAPPADGYAPVTADVGPREAQSLEALAKLRPLFDRRDGTVTVGNACQVTDGAASVLLLDAAHAKASGLEPLASVRGFATAALDPAHMGLGPVHAIDRLLHEAKLVLKDIGLLEINEAFAAQVLACLKAMDSQAYCRRHLGRNDAIGSIDPDRLNVHGGAIALGHPVGATGVRLVLNLVHEMKRRDVELGVAALCVAGGQGAAILLQRS